MISFELESKTCYFRFEWFTLLTAIIVIYLFCFKTWSSFCDALNSYRSKYGNPFSYLVSKLAPFLDGSSNTIMKVVVFQVKIIQNIAGCLFLWFYLVSYRISWRVNQSPKWIQFKKYRRLVEKLLIEFAVYRMLIELFSYCLGCASQLFDEPSKVQQAPWFHSLWRTINEPPVEPFFLSLIP